MPSKFILFGWLLGAANVAYLYLPSQKIGFAFPNLNQNYTIRPTPGRLVAYLLGRWLGYVGLGLVSGWLGTYFSQQLTVRLAYASCILLALFMLEFLITEESPELFLSRLTDPSKKSLPLFVLGLLSAGIILSPTLIGMFLVFTQKNILGGVVLFTNYFFSMTLVSLPVLLNLKWIMEKVYLNIIRMLLIICSFYIAISILIEFIKT